MIEPAPGTGRIRVLIADDTPDIRLLLGIALKLLLPGRYDRASIGLYLTLGWSGVVAYDAVIGRLSSDALWMLAFGGILYSLGVIFHVWRSLPYQNAIWHAFVLAATACHYGTVMATVMNAGA